LFGARLPEVVVLQETAIGHRVSLFVSGVLPFGAATDYLEYRPRFGSSSESKASVELLQSWLREFFVISQKVVSVELL